MKGNKHHVLLLFLFSSIAFHLQAGAPTYYAIASGSYTATNIWSTTACGGVATTTAPGSGDNVVICSPYTVTASSLTISSSGGSSAENITVNAGGTLIDQNSLTVGNGGTITVNAGGTFTVGGAATYNGTAIITSAGTYSVSGTTTSNSGTTINVTGGSFYSGGAFAFNGATVTVSGGSLTTGSTITLNSTSSLSIGTGASVATGTGQAFTDNGASITDNGTLTTGSVTFNSSSAITGSGTLTSSGSTTTNGSSTIWGGKGTCASNCTESNSHPLPITLLSYSAAFNNDAVLLTWASATEVNNNYYTVERTADGNEYTLVATAKGAGNSSDPLAYTAADASPLIGLSYYRLSQTDFDGNNTVLGVLPVTVNIEATDLKVFPNPAKNSCTLSFTDEKIESFQLAVYDYTGRQVLLQNEETAVGVNSTELNIASLPQGMYFITLPANGHLLKTKFIKE